MGSSGHTQGDSVGWGRIPGMSGTASESEGGEVLQRRVGQRGSALKNAARIAEL